MQLARMVVMDLIVLLSSLNKIGLIAFIITLGFLTYEIVLLTKKRRTDEVPQVPQFVEGAQGMVRSKDIKAVPEKNNYKNNLLILIGLSVLLVFFGGLTLAGYLGGENKSLKTDLSAQSLPDYQSAKRVVPTGIVLRKSPVREKPSPTAALLAKAVIPTETPEPTLLAAAVKPTSPPAATYGAAVKISPSITVSTIAAPTIITELPSASYVNNLMIMFGVSAVFLFFAFLY